MLCPGFVPHFANAGASDFQDAATNGAEGFGRTCDDGEISLAKGSVICYTDHAFGDGVPSSMRGVEGLDS